MARNLEGRIRRLEEAAAAYFEGRAGVHDEVFRDWIRNLDETPWLALYPAESPERTVQREIHGRLHELAVTGVTTREVPPEFMANRPERERRLGWLIAADSQLLELLGKSDLRRRRDLVLRGEPPEPISADGE